MDFEITENKRRHHKQGNKTYVGNDVEPQEVAMSLKGNFGFPARLHFMLDDLENDGRDDIVSWQPHGRSFKVHNKDGFVKDVIPRYFQQSKYASFQRQLNIHGFKRITSGPDKNAYYHECFLRGKPTMTRFIQRFVKKGRGGRRPADPATEPNFYRMPFLPTENGTQAAVPSYSSKPKSVHPDVGHVRLAESEKETKIKAVEEGLNPSVPPLPPSVVSLNLFLKASQIRSACQPPYPLQWMNMDDITLLRKNLSGGLQGIWCPFQQSLAASLQHFPLTTLADVPSVFSDEPSLHKKGK